MSEDGFPPLRVAIGQRLAGKYLVTKFIGVGGMSVVVAALHEQLGQTVAIKFLAAPTTSTRTAAYRFFREARAAASLRSEHIVRVTDAGTDEWGRPFMAMEYLEGADLAATLKENGPLALELAVGYVLQACEGIAEANAAGIIHRDLKPANIFLTRRIDGSPLVKVLDFGLSKILPVGPSPDDQSVSHQNSFMGTPLYMSPEQLRDPASVDARTDVWALGVILFELLSGKNPFRAPTMPEIFAAILTGEGVPALAACCPELPPALVQAVSLCLERDATLRTADVGLMARALLPWAPVWARDAGERAARLVGGDASPSPVLDDALAHGADAPRKRRVQSGKARTVAGVGARVALGFAAVLVSAAMALLGARHQTNRQLSSVPAVPAGRPADRPAGRAPSNATPLWEDVAVAPAPAALPSPSPLADVSGPAAGQRPATERPSPALAPHVEHGRSSVAPPVPSLARPKPHRMRMRRAEAPSLRQEVNAIEAQPTKVPADPLEGRR